ncbi:hypothetical protein BJ508DRAFT_417352 [Ascobolus immersus RN42]|uniref:Uncharacterized protein n=1 Tax=Ascobolus immersus RN42 TaxID=1160509 RepID=A0A3N4HUV6_ASCIM|nr:hypothetical protein BJ508DRAFT_417352 [Ascobolus immersus RN42]
MSQYNNPKSTNAGPHSSNLMNKLDPRVDSDRSKQTTTTTSTTTTTGPASGVQQGPGYTQQGPGYTSHTAGYTQQPNTGHHGAGHHQQPYPGGFNNGTGNAGPHSSSLMNKLDPTVDSDLDGRATRRGEFGTTAGRNDAYSDHNAYSSNTIGPGGHHNTHGAGLTSSNAHTAGHMGTQTADPYGAQNLNESRSTGPARHTAGPHKSDLMNKLDPRVDADLGHSVGPTGRTGGY